MNTEARGLLGVLGELPARSGTLWDRLRADLEKWGGTEFGKAHGFSGIRSERDFREAVPVRNYDGYRSWIGRVAAGEKDVLPCGEVLAFERTSGSGGGAKLIPVTEGLREDFVHGLAAWLEGWRRGCPEVFDGRAYWAISPPGIAGGTSAGGLPVGMESDGSYFPERIGAALGGWLVVPELSGKMEDVFRETAEKLLETADLSLVSVWSPTFLLGIDAEISRLRPGKTWSELWPGLALVSCWADAASARWISVLQERLGGIRIEPKGLLATEGITSIPVGGNARLAHECHYHEFLDGEGNHLPQESLRVGTECEVLLTTSGGLMRYRSGDRVRVCGFDAAGIPQMSFLGRTGMACDFVGEKLSEKSVANAFAGARGFLAADASVPGYELWIEETDLGGGVLARLRENPYFRQALELGQLAPVRVLPLREGWATALSVALAKRQGCRIGDVKLPVLFKQDQPGEVAEWLG
jgi:GH3 auxin-responsive promoter